MTNAEVGKRIYNRRQELGLTVGELAERLGLAKSTISRYEHGTIEKIKMPVIESIARALGVNPSWVVGKSADKYEKQADDALKLTSAQVELVNAVEGLTEDRVRFYARMIKELESK